MTRRARSHRPTAALLTLACVIAGSALLARPAEARTDKAVVPAASATASTGVTVAVRPVMLTFVTPLPTARLGIPYSKQLTSIGGSGAMSWVASGSLPSGLTLNNASGLISGTPTTLGTSNFLVFVSGSSSDSQFSSLSVIMPATSTITMTSPSPTEKFGDPYVLSATAGLSPATGTVTFVYAPTAGGDPGNTVTLGTATLDENSVATLSLPIPAFGASQVAATYGGDVTHPAVTSDPVTVEVTAYAGQLIITEFRESGPMGADDSYVELSNTGPTVPLGGIRIQSGTGAVTTLNAYSGTLGTGRSYLVAGAEFPYVPSVTPDSYTGLLGSGGFQVVAPDTVGTRTDAAGPADGPHLGAGLPVVGGAGSSEHAWVREERAGRPRDTGDNAADFRLVSNTAGAFNDVQPALGSAAPTGTSDPYQHNAVLLSTLLDTGVAPNIEPNRTYTPGSPGQLIVRRTITNSSGVTLWSVKLRVTSLSAANGGPKPGVITQPASHANLRIVNGTVANRSGRALPTVTYLNVDPPANATVGGGLNTTLTVPLNAGLAAGATINVAVTFAVDSPGPFWFGYNVDGAESPPLDRAAGAVQRSGPDAAPATIRKHDGTVHGVL